MLNLAQIIGHLGRDPDVRYTADGTAVANLASPPTRPGRTRTARNRNAPNGTAWCCSARSRRPPRSS